MSHFLALLYTRTYVRQFPHRKRCWRGGQYTHTSGVIEVLQELAFFIKYLEKNPKQKTLDVNTAMHVDDDVQFLSILILAEKERLKVHKETKRIAAERRIRDDANSDSRGYIDDNEYEDIGGGCYEIHSPDRKRKRNEISSKSCISDSNSPVGGGGVDKNDDKQQQSVADKQIVKKSKICDDSIHAHADSTSTDNTNGKVSQTVGSSITRYFGDLVHLVGERFGIQRRVRSDTAIPSQVVSTSIPSLEPSTSIATSRSHSSSSSSILIGSVSGSVSGSVLDDAKSVGVSVSGGKGKKCDSPASSNTQHTSNSKKHSSCNSNSKNSSGSQGYENQDNYDNNHDNEVDNKGDNDDVSDNSNDACSSSSIIHPTQSSNTKTTIPEKRKNQSYGYDSMDEDDEEFGGSVNSNCSKEENFHPLWVDELPLSLRSTYEILRPKSQIEKERELAEIRLRTLAKHKAAFGLAACYHPFLAALINGNEASWDSEIDADDDAASGDY